MNQQTINDISEQVYKAFPEIRGVKPKIKKQTPDQTLLVFHGKATTQNGVSLPRLVRVVASQDGKILKMTTSR